MDKAGPIVIIDDDPDDQELMKELLTELTGTQEIVIFDSSDAALRFLRRPEVKPFLILSDIKMPISGGFELRKEIFDDNVLREKCVPYLFLTTGAVPEVIREAYGLSVQGIFQKANSIGEWKNQLKKIVDYWLEAKSPNRY